MSLMFVCLYVLFYVFARIASVDELEKGFIYEKSFEMCICFW